MHFGKQFFRNHVLPLNVTINNENECPFFCPDTALLPACAQIEFNATDDIGGVHLWDVIFRPEAPSYRNFNLTGNMSPFSLEAPKKNQRHNSIHKFSDAIQAAEALLIHSKST